MEPADTWQHGQGGEINYGGKRLGVRVNRKGWVGVENKRVRVRGQEIRTREGKGKMKGGGWGSILLKEHPAVVEMKI